jgi:formamidopyrimidine-DNA glycosylase
MPELPDVEVFRKTIDKKVVNHVIDDFEVDEKKLFKAARGKLDGFNGHKATGTRRIGKYCFLETGKQGWIVFHFGMTGYVEYYEKKEDKPKYSAFTLNLKGKGNLSYISKRKLGKVDLCETPADYAKENKLGIDALECTKKKFMELMEKKKGSIKGALMDQSMISGIGNVYSDEILFQVQVHPATPVQKISRDVREGMYKKMKDVLKKAIAAGAQPDKLPSNYLTPSRQQGNDCPSCKGKIKKSSISGRSSYYCPSCQKKSF